MPAVSTRMKPRWLGSVSQRYSSKNRSMPHSTMPTPMTMPAGGSDRVSSVLVFEAALSASTILGAWLRSHRSTRSRIPKMAKSPMAWKIGTGSRFPTSPA